MAEYEPVDIACRHVDHLVVTGSSPEDQSNFEDLKETTGISRADRIAYPRPFASIADGTLLPAMLKLRELHGYTNVHVMDTVNSREYRETNEYTRLRKLANEAVGFALDGVVIHEHVINSEDEDEEDRRLAATCSDHRFQEAFDATVKHHMGDRTWRIVHPGPSIYIAKHNLIRPIRDIAPVELGIFNHIDCGAGGGQEAHGNDVTREAQAHFRSSRLAETVVSEEFPYLKIHSHVVGIKGEILPPHIRSPETMHENASHN
jgi:hypothetical protein